MATKRQDLGVLGEDLVRATCSCPHCKRDQTLIKLPPNFKCADLICDFCGYVAQVKTSRKADINSLPDRILGAAWEPQRARMDSAIYFPLFLVLVGTKPHDQAIYYLSADLQQPPLFKPRKPLGVEARRAGWQGFTYELADFRTRFVRLA